MSEFRSQLLLHGLSAVAGRRCEARGARGWWPRVAREGWVTPRRWNAFDAFPWGAGPRDAAVDTRKQAGKALRSQGHHHARVM